jgi:hypothetical protein
MDVTAHLGLPGLGTMPAAWPDDWTDFVIFGMAMALDKSGHGSTERNVAASRWWIR